MDADDIMQLLKEKHIEEAYSEMNYLRNKLWDKLKHYKAVFVEHNIELPFSEP